ncbi:hypothetical protein [Paenibacillus sp. IHBB 10380]|uniref:hypothetical protein n=1 Tax=Paenibacillus sp. IHBB 10380 TaxID=1566358 RepID=UPI000A867891|nr:hypothetical protein [Paenibacillus sp. IHBB 10380]
MNKPNKQEQAQIESTLRQLERLQNTTDDSPGEWGSTAEVRNYISRSGKCRGIGEVGRSG